MRRKRSFSLKINSWTCEIHPYQSHFCCQKMGRSTWMWKPPEASSQKSVWNSHCQLTLLKKPKWLLPSNRALLTISRKLINLTATKKNKERKTEMWASTVLLTHWINHQGNTWKMIKPSSRNQAELDFKNLVQIHNHLLENSQKSDIKSCKSVLKKQSSFALETGNLNETGKISIWTERLKEVLGQIWGKLQNLMHLTSLNSHVKESHLKI